MASPTLAITGATGFVGQHLVRLAREHGFRVWAVGRDETAPAEIVPFIDEYFSADLTQGWPLMGEMVGVVHLAGLAAVGASFSEPQRYIESNSRMVTHMCESLLSRRGTTRVLIVSSGAVYRPRVDDAAIDESSATSATSPYAVAKLLVESQAAYYAHRGMDIAVARPFNHIGPGQGGGFLIPDIARSLRDLPEGRPLAVGNLDTARDYTDVRDVARAYLGIIAAPELRHSVYNVASGASRSGREILVETCRLMGRPVPELQLDERRLRPGDPERVVGSATRLRREFGWAPTIGWQTSIADYLSGRVA